MPHQWRDLYSAGGNTTHSIHSVFVFVPFCWLRIRSYNESVCEYIWSNGQEERDNLRRKTCYSRLILMKLFSDHGQPHHSQTERIKAQAHCLWPEELSLFRIRSALSRRQQSCRSASTVQSTVQPTAHIGFQYPCPIRASHAVRRSL